MFMKINDDNNDNYISKLHFYETKNHAIINKNSKGLLIVTKGSIIWQAPASTNQLNENDIIYLKQGTYALQSKEKESELLWIPLNDNFLRDYLNKYGDILSEIKRCDESLSDVIKFTNTPLLLETCHSLLSFLTHDCPETLINLRLSELMLLLSYSDKGSELMSNLRQLSNRQAERLQIFMENNYLKEWKLNEFSKEFGMGLTTFKELFNSVYATSPRAWISEKRIMYAHQLLINTDMSIVEISMEAGFSSQSYFTQSYRKRFGYTPSRSRNTSD